MATWLRKVDMPLDAWQQGLVTAVLGKRETGQYACGIGGAVVSIPRQAGKTYTFGALAFALCLANPNTLVLWSAHRARTHQETFKSMTSMAERPSVAPFVKRSLTGAGTEAVEFANGSRILFGARENGFGRGFAKVDVLVLDEAQILTEKAMEDMVPATNASPNGLVLLMGTPPRPSDPGEVFRLRRESALSGEDADVLYVELSADTAANPDDRKQWSKANPSFPFRTGEGAILRMRKLLGSVESFKREGLGIWDERQQGRKAFGPGLWSKRVAEPPSAGVRSFGVKFTPDGSHVAIAGALRPKDGVGAIHVEAIRQAPMSEGTQWLIDFFIERRADFAQVMVDGRAGAGYLVNALRAEGLRKSQILVPSVEQAVTAHSMLDRAVTQGEVTHSGQSDLDLQAEGAIRRKIGTAGGFGWDTEIEGETVALLDAVTLAHYAAKTTKRSPGRKQAFL
ncbi:terminase large subunit domain-containing protein [Brachybacterium alimentarium]|uniref:terminase large subunit domain-containing protein n=1 Tax=Brachybacterium alimentarium TaxID=47845 RepID=UPI003FCFB28D